MMVEYILYLREDIPAKLLNPVFFFTLNFYIETNLLEKRLTK